MKFLEKNLESIIWEAYQGGKIPELANRGLEINGDLYRQQVLGNYGQADLIEIVRGISGSIWNITVYELKQDEVNEKALSQACRYLTALKSIFGNEDEIEYNVVLIGASFNQHSDFAFLLNELDFVSIYLYEYRIDGIWFNEVGRNWKISRENFARNIRELFSPKIEESDKEKSQEPNNQEDE